MTRFRLPSIPSWIGKSVAVAAFAAGVLVLMLWLMGAFRAKIDSRDPVAAAPHGVPAHPHTVSVVRTTVPLEETAVGAIQPVHRVELASRLLARVVEVNAIAGQPVTAGMVLVRLEDTDLRARLSQAQAAVDQAQAALDQARIEEMRMRSAYERGAVAEIEMERAVNAVRSAHANLARAQQSQTEADTVLEYATIRSPINGAVVDKRISSGDTVSPGQVVVTLLDPAKMQLVASVRESLARHLAVGAPVSVQVDVLEHACQGLVSEIVPEAQSTSRTFQVKVTGPCPEGIYAGMFGRLSIPTGQEQVLLVPRAALRRVGQVDFVEVIGDGLRQRRAVRLGRTFGDQVEVLSGLADGEQVLIREPEEPQ